MGLQNKIDQFWNEYIKLRQSGLKKQANRSLLDIVELIESNGCSHHKDFLLKICKEGLSDDYTKRLQHPIFTRCILPLLVDGYQHGSHQELILLVKAKNSGYFGDEIFKYLGNIDNKDILKKILSTDANNEIAINLLAREYIESLYFGAHHLPEALIISDDYADLLLNDSAFIFEKYKNYINDRAANTYKYYNQLYSDYKTWKTGTFHCSFEEWCDKNNLPYRWVNSYYYE